MKIKYKILIFLSLVTASLLIISSTFILSYFLYKDQDALTVETNFNSDYLYTNNDYYIKFNTSKKDDYIKKYYLKINDDVTYLYNSTNYYFKNLNWNKYIKVNLEDKILNFNCLNTVKEIFEKEIGNNGVISVNNEFNFQFNIYLNSYKYSTNFNIMTNRNKFIF